MQKIKLLSFGLFAVILFGCDSNVGNNATSTNIANKTLQSTQKLANLKGTAGLFTIGGTYDTMSSHPTPTTTCLRDGANPSNWIIKNPKASLDFSQSQSLQTIERALGIDYSETINAGPFSANTAFKYGYSAQDTDYALNINYVYQYAGTAMFNHATLVQGESSLVPQAVALLHSSPADFRQMCGDGYVSALDAGVSLLFHLTLKFDSLVEKNYYSDSFDKVAGLESILAKIMSNQSGIHYSLIASGLQLGGAPQLLNNIFIQNGGSLNGYNP